MCRPKDIKNIIKVPMKHMDQLLEGANQTINLFNIIKNVRALHSENQDVDGSPKCVECNVFFPCDTIQTLDGDI